MRTKQPRKLEKGLLVLAFAGLYAAAYLCKISDLIKKQYYNITKTPYVKKEGFFPEYIRTDKL